MLIGVYGTLKRGFRADYLLKHGKFLISGFFKIPFKMYDTGSFPVLVKDVNNHKHNIFLEIFEINDPSIITSLDMYEGYPSLFVKSVVDNITDDIVVIYTAGKGLEEDANNGLYEIIKSGKYE